MTDRFARIGALLAMALLLLSCSPTPPPVQAIAGPDYPEQLSGWNILFRNGDYLRPNQQVHSYVLASALFSDYAHKWRTIWIPAGTSVTAVDGDEHLQFPVGTIISKTFYYPRDPAGSTARVTKAADLGGIVSELDIDQVRLIETRILTLGKQGWVALPYVWNQQQTDAELAIAGDVVELELAAVDSDQVEHFSYIVPDKNQCAGCHVTNHSSKQLRPIGPKLRHLDRVARFDDTDRNQLEHWISAGLLVNNSETHIANAGWRDQRQPLGARARAYLDINCGHCHNATGPADTSGLWLDASVSDPVRLGRCKPPIAAGRGSGGHAYGLVPGVPEKSIMIHRMASRNPAVAMPELGRTLDDSEGTALIAQWIEQMPGGCD